MMAIDSAEIMSRASELGEERRRDSEPAWEPREERSLIAITQWEPTDLGPVVRGEQVTAPPSVLMREDGVFLLYPGRVNMFMGETESLKTWMALVAVVQELAAGHHVIYLDFEDGPESVVERLRALGATVDQIVAHLTYINPSGRFDELAAEALDVAIERKGAPTLAVVDGVTEAMGDIGLDPSSGPDVAAYYGSSPRWLARTGAAVVLVDHVTKSRENRGRWAIGSERKLSGLTGAAYGFEMIRPFGRGKTGTVKVTVAKDRCGHVRQHEGVGRTIVMAELQSFPDGGISATLSIPEASDDGAFRPTWLMTKLSEAIVENPGLSTRALRAAVKGKNEAKDLALELLVNEGYVDVELGPNRSRQHVSLRPFWVIEGGDSDEVF